jgi:hypothetical protein
MKKYLSLFAAVMLLLSLLTGCVGTPVVIQDCTCPSDGETVPTTPAAPIGEGAVKTGLAVITTATDSTSATADAAGSIKLDSTLVAVTVDDQGVITSCIIDSIPATVGVDATGTITSDITAAVPTKNELGADYGMVAWGGAIAEWDSQVAALCHYAVGKTVEELKTGAIDETGKAQPYYYIKLLKIREGENRDTKFRVNANFSKMKFTEKTDTIDMLSHFR